MRALEAASLWLVPLAVFVAPLALGSVHPWTAAALYAAVGAAGLAWARARDFPDARLHPLAAAGAVVVGALLLQLLPLPTAMVRALSPWAAMARDAASQATGVAWSWAPLSLEPTETLREAVRVAGLVLVFLVSLNVSRQRDGAARILAAVAMTGVALVATGLLHQALGTDQVLGFYQSVDVRSVTSVTGGGRLLTTLVNANHAAALLTVSTLVLLGAALNEEDGRLRGLSALGALVTGAAVFGTGSRAGAASLVFGGGLLLGWRLVLPALEDAGRGGRALVVAGVVLTIALVHVGILAYDDLVLTPAGRSMFGAPGTLSKVRVWQDLLPLLGAFPWTGTGAGALPSVAPAFGGSAARLTVWYAESQPLQVLLDLGLLFGVAALLATWTALGGIAARALASGRLAGATCALLALGLHDLADFSLHVAGVGLPAAALLGVVAGRIAARDPGPPRRWHAVPTRGWLALCVGLSGFALLGTAIGDGHGLRDDREAIGRACRKSAARSCLDVVQAAAERHPADDFPFLVGGRLALARGDRSTARAWLTRAAAACDGCLEPGLALGDLDLAEDRDAEASSRYLALAADRTHAPEVLWHFHELKVPPARLAALLMADAELADDFGGRLISWGRRADAERFLLALMKDGGMTRKRLWILGDLYLGNGVVDAADRIATRLMARFPDALEGFSLQARVESARGRFEQALVMVREARRRGPEDVRLAVDELAALEGLGQFDDFDALAGTLDEPRLRQAGANTQFHLVMADRMEKAGRLREALAEVQRARQAAPRFPPVLLKLARIHEQNGDLARAAEAYQEALRLQPGNPAALAGLKHLGQEP